MSNLGSLKIKLGENKEALLLLVKATKSSPEIAQVWNNLTNGYFQLGLLKEAEESIRKSIEIDPNSFFSYFIFANILIE